MEIGTFFSQIEQSEKNGEVGSISEAFEKLTLQGISFVDVRASMLDERYNPDALCAYLKRNGVRTGSVFHLMNFEYMKDNALTQLREDTKKRLEDCARLECDIFMPVPAISTEHTSQEGRSECRKKVIEYLNDVAYRGKAYNITTVVENFSDLKSPFATVEDIKDILDNTQDVYYVLDTGNFWFSDSDVICACESFSDKIRHVHLKEINPVDAGGYLNINGKSCNSNDLGGGVIPFEEIFKRLRSYGYNETATIEINDPTSLLDKTIRSLDYLKSIGVM